MGKEEEPAKKKEESTEKKSLSFLQIVIVAAILGFSFLITHLVLIPGKPTISQIPALQLFLIIPEFDSLMFWAMSLFGFFAVFFLVDWVNKEFETKLALNPFFPVIFFAVAFIAYYIALFWYMSNFATLSGSQLQIEELNELLWGRIHSSAFMPFMWFGVFGWIARYAIERIDLQS